MSASKEIQYEIVPSTKQAYPVLPFTINRITIKTFKKQVSFSRVAVATAATKKVALAIVAGLNLDESLGKIFDNAQVVGVRQADAETAAEYQQSSGIAPIAVVSEAPTENIIVLHAAEAAVA